MYRLTVVWKNGKVQTYTNLNAFDLRVFKDAFAGCPMYSVKER